MRFNLRSTGQTSATSGDWVSQGTGFCISPVQSAQSLPTKVIDHVKYVGAKIEINGSVQAVHKFIHAVESSKPYLFVTGAVLKSSSAFGRPGPQEPIIDAQFEIFGAVQGQAP